MKRGLKVWQWFKLVGPLLVEETSPMKRGLKVGVLIAVVRLEHVLKRLPR